MQDRGYSLGCALRILGPMIAAVVLGVYLASGPLGKPHPFRWGLVFGLVAGFILGEILQEIYNRCTAYGTRPFFGKPDVDKMETRREGGALARFLVHSQDAAMRQAAEEALVRIKGPTAVNPLINELRFSLASPEQSLAAIRTLGRIGDARAIDWLITALKKQDLCVAAATTLGQTRSRRAVEPLIAALKDAASASHFSRSGSAGLSTPAFIFALVQNKRYKRLRKAATRALAQIGAPAIRPLQAFLKEEKGAAELPAHVAAIRALGLIGAPALDALLLALDDRTADVCKAACAELRKIDLAPLISRLQDGDEKVRRQAAYRLGLIGSSQTRQLLAALEDQALLAAAWAGAERAEQVQFGWYRPTDLGTSPPYPSRR